MAYSDLDYEQDYGGIGNSPLFDKFKNYMSANIVQPVMDFRDANQQNFRNQMGMLYDEAPNIRFGKSKEDFVNGNEQALEMAANMGSIAPKWKSVPPTVKDVTNKVLGIADDSYLYSKEYKGLKKSQDYANKHLDRYKEAHPNSKSELDDIWLLDDDIEALVSAMNSRDSADWTLQKLENMKDSADSAVKNYEKRQFRQQYSDRPLTHKYPEWNGESETFNLNTTNFPFMDERLQSGQAKIVSMSPEEYLRASQVDVFGLPYESIRGINRENVADYAQRMVGGSKAPMPYLRFGSDGFGQEGRHRAVAANLLGEKEIPVVLDYGKY